MKYVICVPDGAADEPVAELGGRTPLEAAAMPNLAALAARGELGRAATIPAGMPPGSDVGNLSILGYDPARYHTGRAPIEAAAMGLELRDDQVAYRLNLVRVDDGIMADFAGGHPSTEDAAGAVKLLDASLGSDEISFHPGVQYRHILVVPESWADATCTPPHDLTGRPAIWPTGPAAPRLQALMDESRRLLEGLLPGANQIWLWGQGHQPRLPAFRDLFGVHAQLVSAVDLVRGLGALTGIESVDVAGITGWYDTDYEAKRDAALSALSGDIDLFLIHVEASDEAGHAGDLGAKLEALENWDRRIIGPLIEGLDDIGPWRLLLLPDHPTPVELRTHTDAAVPYLLVGSTGDRPAGPDGQGGVYSERGVASLPVVPGHSLMPRLVGS